MRSSGSSRARPSKKVRLELGGMISVLDAKARDAQKENF